MFVPQYWHIPCSCFNRQNLHVFLFLCASLFQSKLHFRVDIMLTMPQNKKNIITYSPEKPNRNSGRVNLYFPSSFSVMLCFVVLFGALVKSYTAIR